MTARYGRRIAGLRAQPGDEVRDLHVDDAEFLGCVARVSADPAQRLRISQTTLSRCGAYDCYIEGARLEDVVVDGLDTNDMLRVCGSVFRRVVIKGAMGCLQIVPWLHMSYENLQPVYDRVNRDFYATVDWALDISQAVGVPLDIRGVPGRLVRRNPETQGLMTFEQALLGSWRSVDLAGTHFASAPKLLLDEGLEDILLIADQRSPDLTHQIAVLERLRQAGAILPD